MGIISTLEFCFVRLEKIKNKDKFSNFSDISFFGRTPKVRWEDNVLVVCDALVSKMSLLQDRGCLWPDYADGLS